MLDRTEQLVERHVLRGLPPHCADRPARIANDAMKPLARMVARFCSTLARLPDRERPSDCSGARARPGGHAIPSELYEQAVQIRQHLLHLGAGIGQARSGTVTSTQRSLRQLQRAYRGLQGVMIGVPDRLLDLRTETQPRSIRQLLHRAMAGASMQAPAAQSVIWSSPSVCCSMPGPLSKVFECGELIQRSVVDGLRDTPDPLLQAPGARGSLLAAVIINARIDDLSRHLQDHRMTLSQLLKATGHRRTVPMRLAHRIFIALGDVEGSMIGAESRFESACQPMIDLIGVRTNDLGRYC